MPDRDEEVWGVDGPNRLRPSGPIEKGLFAAARALEAEADRWFLWLPVLFAAGIVTYCGGAARQPLDNAVAGEGAFRCDPLGCIGQVKGKTVGLVRHPGALEEDCRIADIVIAPFTIQKTCRARVIVDRRMLREAGAHALYIEGLSIRTETVAQAHGKRPWARSAD